MRTLQQSPELRELWSKQLGKKISDKRQAAEESAQEVFGMGFLGSLAFEVNQFKNQFKGSVGETAVSLLLRMLPDTWVMFNNALIPINSGGLTEIDTIIIGTGGIFLVEIKTWKGSFSAYKDKWKRREGNNWVVIENSPSSQNAYHQKIFKQWIAAKLPSFDTELVKAPVVFTVAKWLGTNDCSVPVLHGVRSLIDLLINSPNCLTLNQVNEIAELIKNCSISPPATPTPRVVPKPILKAKKPQ